MTKVEQLAAFVVRTKYEDLSEEACQQLKIRILDALGCAIGAVEGPPIRMLRAQHEDFGGKPLSTLIGGDKTGNHRWYEEFVPVADNIYDNHLQELLQESEGLKNGKEL